MRNGNKSPKFTYSAMVREVESVSWTGSPPQVDQFFRFVGRIITPSFYEIG